MFVWLISVNISQQEHSFLVDNKLYVQLQLSKTTLWHYAPESFMLKSLLTCFSKDKYVLSFPELQVEAYTERQVMIKMYSWSLELSQGRTSCTLYQWTVIIWRSNGEIRHDSCHLNTIRRNRSPGEWGTLDMSTTAIIWHPSMNWVCGKGHHIYMSHNLIMAAGMLNFRLLSNGP